jgi:regulator of RNase E activity RraA
MLHDLGIHNVVMRGIRALVPVTGSAAGPARTLHFLPAREDLPKPPRGAINRKLIDSVGSGEMIVIDAGGYLEGAVLGDMLAGRAAFRGAAGVVADGVMRDIASIVPLGLPVFARGSHPAPNGYGLLAWEIDGPIQCGGVLVQPGDWILADGDSVIVIPASKAEEVAEKALAVGDEEEFCARLIAAGFPIDEAYPLPPARRADFDRFKLDGTVPAWEG